MSNLTLDTLVAAIRSGASSEELNRMVGPSAEETEVLRARLERLDALDAKCDWASFTPNIDAQEARERRDPLVREQGAYENTYC